MRWLTICSVALVGVGMMAASVCPVRAQIDSREGIALQNQIYQLRQELQQARDQAARGGGGPAYTAPPPPSFRGGSGDIVTQLLTRVSSLEEQVRELRGQVDQTQHIQQQQAADFSKRLDDLAFQANTPRGAGSSGTQSSAGSALSPPQAAPGDGPPAPPPSVRRTPELMLQEANTSLAKRNYAAAEQAAREVLNSSRTSPRTYDAQFVLAQALAGQRQYAQSAIAFDDAYNRNRKGTHAPDALIGLASSLNALNEKKAACDTLTKLGSEFPDLRPNLRESAASTRQRAGCR